MVFRRLLCLWITISFSATLITPPPDAGAQTILDLPAPGTMVLVSPSFEPALIRGLTVHQDNPFLFDFIVDPGQDVPKRSGPVIASAGFHAGHSELFAKQSLKEQADRMIKYFFAALTIPDRDIWVNLSPYEKDRMIPVTLGETVMGRDLLAQDYMLKQLTASLIYPQKALGKTFWAKVYAKAQALYGTTQIPVNTFNKVWIVPQKAGIYEHGQTAFIVDGHLKVMLEEDYLSLTKHTAISPSLVKEGVRGSSTNPLPLALRNDTHSIGANIIRQIILPEIEREINEGKNFATLRQIFYAQVLAVWFKRNLKQALLNRVYANKGTVKGIDQNDAATNEAIYHQYLRAYKKGVFNYIQEDKVPCSVGSSCGDQTIARKYFSGGYGDLALLSIKPEEFSNADKATAAKDFDFAVMAVPPQVAALLVNQTGPDMAMAGGGRVKVVFVTRAINLILNKLGIVDQGNQNERTLINDFLSQNPENSMPRAIALKSALDFLVKPLNFRDFDLEHRVQILSLFFKDGESAESILSQINKFNDPELRVRVAQIAQMFRNWEQNSTDLLPVELTYFEILSRILQSEDMVKEANLAIHVIEKKNEVASLAMTTDQKEKIIGPVLVITVAILLFFMHVKPPHHVNNNNNINIYSKTVDDWRRFNDVGKGLARIYGEQQKVVFVSNGGLASTDEIEVPVNFKEGQLFFTLYAENFLREQREIQWVVNRKPMKIKITNTGFAQFRIPKDINPGKYRWKIKSDHSFYFYADSLHKNPLVTSYLGSKELTFKTRPRMVRFNVGSLRSVKRSLVNSNKAMTVKQTFSLLGIIGALLTPSFFGPAAAQHRPASKGAVKQTKVTDPYAAAERGLNDILKEIKQGNAANDQERKEQFVRVIGVLNDFVGRINGRYFDNTGRIQVLPRVGRSYDVFLSKMYDINLKMYIKHPNDPIPFIKQVIASIRELSHLETTLPLNRPHPVDGSIVVPGRADVKPASMLDKAMINEWKQGIISTLAFLAGALWVVSSATLPRLSQQPKSSVTINFKTQYGDTLSSIRQMIGPMTALEEKEFNRENHFLLLDTLFQYRQHTVVIPPRVYVRLSVVKKGELSKAAYKALVYGNPFDPRVPVIDTDGSVFGLGEGNEVTIRALLKPKELQGFQDRVGAMNVTEDGMPILDKGMSTPTGGIDLSQQDAALHVEKDANGGVKVNVDPALIARIERDGMPEVDPVIINERPADIQALFGVSASMRAPAVAAV